MSFSLKDFKNIEKVGEGGHGKIYRAVQISLQRRVVIKEMAGGLLESQEQLRWLEQEAATAASLEHDNIVRIYDFGCDRGSFFLVMEYIDGLDFARLLALEKFPKELGLMIMLLALRGLHYAHTKGIVHCDFKPNNILVSRTGRVLVTDFGMAYPDPKSVRLTTQGKIFLTPAFMPPEVAVEIEGQGPVKELFSETSPVSAGAEAAERLKKPDIRRDIWSAGVVLFRILSGRFPFTGDNIPQLIASIMLTEVPPLEALAPALPSSLTAAIGSCLEKRPDKRLATLEPLIEPLEKFFIDLNISDCEKEICIFFADAGAVVRRLEQKLLVYHNREWRACKRAGNAAREAVHLQEAERYASIVLSAAGVSTGPLIPPPAPRRPRKPRVVFALAAAAITAVSAAIILRIVSGGFYNNTFRSVPPAAAAPSEQTPVKKQPDVAMTVAMPAVDSGAIKSDTALPQFTDIRSDTVVPAAPRVSAASAAPAPRRPASGATPQENGLLMISISPETAQVFADERPFSAEETAFGKTLKTGSHFIVATADGYEPYWGSLDIAANQTSTLSIRLVPIPENHGYLRISVSPPSSLYIDGVFRGATQTASTIALRAGEHYVTLRCRGHKSFERTIVIDSSGTAVIEATLEPSGR
ncbi:MAG: serine/threonine protein kinase [Chitinispirillaceae bacterium]|nr:serine/threonine protein kinase [Chitinispirillaceae bacterium]